VGLDLQLGAGLKEPTELYWFLLAAAAGLVSAGTLLLKERTQLWWQLATAVAVVVLIMQ